MKKCLIFHVNHARSPSGATREATLREVITARVAAELLEYKQ